MDLPWNAAGEEPEGLAGEVPPQPGRPPVWVQGMVVLGTPLGCGSQLKCTKLGEAIPPHPYKSPGIAKASLDIIWRAISECLKAIIACAECNHHHVV